LGTAKRRPGCFNETFASEEQGHAIFATETLGSGPRQDRFIRAATLFKPENSLEPRGIAPVAETRIRQEATGQRIFSLLCRSVAVLQDTYRRGLLELANWHASEVRSRLRLGASRHPGKTGDGI
jgi:hypothetical protein